VDTEPDCGASLVICRLTGRGRTDDRFLSSIAQGLRPAKSHEKPLGYASACQPAGRPGFFDPVGMGVPPAKLHEKPAEANKSGTEGEQKAGFFAPVEGERRQTTKGDGLSYRMLLAAERHRRIHNRRAPPGNPRCQCGNQQEHRNHSREGERVGWRHAHQQ
jgi:hypothetical protein